MSHLESDELQRAIDAALKKRQLVQRWSENASKTIDDPTLHEQLSDICRNEAINAVRNDFDTTSQRAINKMNSKIEELNAVVTTTLSRKGLARRDCGNKPTVKHKFRYLNLLSKLLLEQAEIEECKVVLSELEAAKTAIEQAPNQLELAIREREKSVEDWALSHQNISNIARFRILATVCQQEGELEAQILQQNRKHDIRFRIEATQDDIRSLSDRLAYLGQFLAALPAPELPSATKHEYLMAFADHLVAQAKLNTLVRLKQEFVFVPRARTSGDE